MPFLWGLLQTWDLVALRSHVEGYGRATHAFHGSQGEAKTLLAVCKRARRMACRGIQRRVTHARHGTSKTWSLQVSACLLLMGAYI